MDKLKKISLILLALAVLLPGLAYAFASQVPAPYPTTWWVTGTLVPGDTGVQDLSGFSVYFYSNSGDPASAYAIAETDSNGDFLINAHADLRLLPLSVGGYYLAVASREVGEKFYQVEETTREITAADLANGYKEAGELVLAPMFGTLSGTLNDSITGDPLAGVKVEIIDPETGETLYESITDENGYYSIPDVPFADYMLKISLPGYESVEQDISVGSEKIDFGGIALIKALNIITTSLPNGLAEQSYLATIEVEGGEPPYSFSVSEGELAKGLSLNAETGKISGTPSESGEFTFTVKVEDSGVPERSDAQAFTIEKICFYEPLPSIEVRFGKRLYQERPDGKKFVISERPDISVTVSAAEGTALSSKIDEYSIELNPGTPLSKQLTLTQDMAQQVYASGSNKIQTYSINYAYPENVAALANGANIFKFGAKTAGSEFGIASVATSYATVEVAGGPLAVLDIPITYPSPFDMRTQSTVTIQYTLSQNADIDIYVIDVGGSRVKRFNCDSGAEGGSAGINKITWDGRNPMGMQVGNGIYVGTIVARQEGRLLAKFKLTVVTSGTTGGG